jgi:hypothetical protein
LRRLCLPLHCSLGYRRDGSPKRILHALEIVLIAGRPRMPRHLIDAFCTLYFSRRFVVMEIEYEASHIVNHCHRRASNSNRQALHGR